MEPNRTCNITIIRVARRLQQKGRVNTLSKHVVYPAIIIRHFSRRSKPACTFGEPWLMNWKNLDHYMVLSNRSGYCYTPQAAAKFATNQYDENGDAETVVRFS